MSHTAAPAAEFQPALTVFMLVKSRREWLALDSDARGRMLREHVEPVLAQYRDSVRLRAYDVEFYATRVTDVWMWEAANHQAYEAVVEALRDTPFWDHLFDIVEILPGSSNAYGKH